MLDPDFQQSLWDNTSHHHLNCLSCTPPQWEGDRGVCVVEFTNDLGHGSYLATYIDAEVIDVHFVERAQ